jgi:hypothetical protein
LREKLTRVVIVKRKKIIIINIININGYKEKISSVFLKMSLISSRRMLWSFYGMEGSELWQRFGNIKYYL